MKMREIASVVGVTERAVQKIIADLTHEGYIEIDRAGRCNKYRLHTEMHLRHPIEAGHTIAELLHVIRKTPEEADGFVSDAVSRSENSGR
jgi:predicted ArsR family transcriptional regulator